ncbi:hypothetical protein ACFLU4_06395, partial [Chloroflexota bacterium]
PFFFVMSPALVAQLTPEAGIIRLLQDFATCALGLVVISCGLQGMIYMIKGVVGLPVRILLFFSGLALAIPQAIYIESARATHFVASLPALGQTFFAWSDLIGLVATVAIIVLYLLWRKIRPPQEAVAVAA